jgi:hypothetical protein
MDEFFFDNQAMDEFTTTDLLMYHLLLDMVTEAVGTHASPNVGDKYRSLSL